jgi:hypothetical protein
VAYGCSAAAVGTVDDTQECFETVSVNLGSVRTIQEIVMNLSMNLSIAPLVALVAGILILVVPRLLNYIVAIYLIITGLLGLFGGGGEFHHFR